MFDLVKSRVQALEMTSFYSIHIRHEGKWKWITGKVILLTAHWWNLLCVYSSIDLFEKQVIEGLNVELGDSNDDVMRDIRILKLTFSSPHNSRHGGQQHTLLKRKPVGPDHCLPEDAEPLDYFFLFLVLTSFFFAHKFLCRDRQKETKADKMKAYLSVLIMIIPGTLVQ